MWWVGLGIRCLDGTTTASIVNPYTQLQVQDFKAGFEFLFRKAQAAKAKETELSIAQSRIAELELELQRQQVNERVMNRVHFVAACLLRDNFLRTCTLLQLRNSIK